MQSELYGYSMLTLLRRTDLAVIHREDVLLCVINWVIKTVLVNLLLYKNDGCFYNLQGLSTLSYAQ